MYVQVHC